jgi:NAD(P)-dependent dehydrogenase (short-subunit alcohol dehydrogenase family)
MKTLDGKLVAITGAASGIGRALALRCAALGARLALVDVDMDGLAETADGARAHGKDVDTQRLDVADRAAIHRWAHDVRERLGGADVLVNNAGVSLSHSIEKMRDEDFEWLFNINFWGVANGCKAFLPQLRERPEAHIVNVSSVYGLIGIPTQAAYNAAKFAVRGYTEALRQELRPTNVRVTSVHPGGIDTNIVRHGRHYEDAAEAIVGAILREKPRLLIGTDARIIDLLARLLPSHYDWVVERVMRSTATRT